MKSTTKAMSYIRAAARQNRRLAALVNAIDASRSKALKQQVKVLEAAETICEFAACSPHVSSRGVEIVIDKSGSWLVEPSSGIFRLNRESWGLLTQPFEEAERELMSAVAGKSSLIYDIGANFGYHSIPLARAHPELRIDAFEAVPATAGLLEANLLRNGITRVSVIRAAVSNAAGETEITTEFTTGNYIATEGSGVRARTVTVPTLRIDDHWNAAGRPAVGFVKVDVEGAEWLVLDGAREFLRTARPTLMMELSAEWLSRFGKTREDCVRIIRESGYRLGSAIERDAARQPLSDFVFTSAGNYWFEP